MTTKPRSTRVIILSGRYLFHQLRREPSSNDVPLIGELSTNIKARVSHSSEGTPVETTTAVEIRSVSAGCVVELCVQGAANGGE